MSETWRPIPGWEELYEASDLGHIRSLDRIAPAGRHRARIYRGRVLKLCTNPKTGYRFVNLSRNGKPRPFLVHRLVLAAFAGPAPVGTLCCHGDGDRTNNRASNLRWDTQSENVRDSMRHGTNPFIRLNAERSSSRHTTREQS